MLFGGKPGGELVDRRVGGGRQLGLAFGLFLFQGAQHVADGSHGVPEGHRVFVGHHERGVLGPDDIREHLGHVLDVEGQPLEVPQVPVVEVQVARMQVASGIGLAAGVGFLDGEPHGAGVGCERFRAAGPVNMLRRPAFLQRLAHVPELLGEGLAQFRDTQGRGPEVQRREDQQVHDDAHRDADAHLEEVSERERVRIVAADQQHQERRRRDPVPARTDLGQAGEDNAQAHDHRDRPRRRRAEAEQHERKTHPDRQSDERLYALAHGTGDVLVHGHQGAQRGVVRILGGGARHEGGDREGDARGQPCLQGQLQPGPQQRRGDRAAGGAGPSAQRGGRAAGCLFWNGHSAHPRAGRLLRQLDEPREASDQAEEVGQDAAWAARRTAADSRWARPAVRPSSLRRGTYPNPRP